MSGRLSFALGCALLHATVATAQSTIFAVAIETGATAIPSVYQNGRLFAAQVSPHRFAAAMMPGLTMAGHLVQVRVDSVNDSPDEGEDELNVHVVGTAAKNPSFSMDTTTTAYGAPKWLEDYARNGETSAVLAWRGPARPRILASKEEPLDSDLLKRLHPIADSLWHAALIDLSTEDRNQSYKFGFSYQLRTDSAAQQVIWVQAISDHGDPRGSFFFLLSGSQILTSSFGHPEWSPNSGIMQTRPYAIIRIGADPRTWVLCTYDSAWESPETWTFIDLATGAVLTAPTAPSSD